jgi:hypothetical protein
VASLVKESVKQIVVRALNESGDLTAEVQVAGDSNLGTLVRVKSRKPGGGPRYFEIRVKEVL